MPRLTYIPNRILDMNGISDGASVTVYQSGTTTKIALYSDPAGTVLATNPYTVAAGAPLPAIYYIYTGDIRLYILLESGEIQDEDPYSPFLTVATASSYSVGFSATRAALAALTGMAAGNSRYLAESGREGEFVWSSENNAANVTADPQQGVYVAPTSAPTGTSGAWVRKFDGPIHLNWFGAITGNDAANAATNNAAFLAAVTYCATTGAKLQITHGNYYYSVSPNWGVDFLEVVAEGRVNFYYTGTGNALIFDAGPDAADLCFGVKFAVGNPVHVYAPATALNGVYCRSIHHSHINANVHGCGTTYAALCVEFAVVTEFNVVVSVNEDGGWYAPGGVSAKPAIGYYLSRRTGGETTSYCYFPNPIVEGVPIGIYLLYTLSNLFVGGTSEGCTEYGVFAGTNATGDRFFGTDFELNTLADIYCQGSGIKFIECDSYTNAAFGTTAKRCVIQGGDYQTILLDAGSIGCTVADAAYNRFISSGTFTDAGTGTTIRNLRQGGTPYTQWGTGSATYDPASLADGEGVTTTVTVTGAVLGDYAAATFSLDLQGITLTAWVSAADTVSVRYQNETTGVINLASGTLRARIERG